MTNKELIKQVIAQDVSFGELLTAYAKAKNTPEHKRLIKKAKRVIHREGEIEIDDNAICSGPEDGSGTHVLAWVWVDA